MASPVNTSVKHFHSGMLGAPVLSGTAGSLLNVLDACLRDGFGLITATSLVVTAGVATLSFTGSHAATVDSVVLVAGSDIAALNGEQKVTAVGPGFVKFSTSVLPATASGTITCKMAAAGWLSPFTDTNIRTYKSADPASTGMILRVDDTGTNWARVVGYEQMTDISTGTGAFPTNAQIAGGGYWSKSYVANTAAAPWVLVADGRKFILHINSYFPENASYLQGNTRGFGDDISQRPSGDPYACSLNYSRQNTVGAQTDGGLDSYDLANNAMPRIYTGLGTAEVVDCSPYMGHVRGRSGADGQFGAFPNQINGGMHLSKKYFSGSGYIRSDLPGLYHVPMLGLFDYYRTRDILTGDGALAGRKLIAFNPAAAGYSPPHYSNTGVSWVDITGPWR